MLMIVLALRLNCTLPSGLLREVAVSRDPVELILNELVCPRTLVLMLIGPAVPPLPVPLPPLLPPPPPLPELPPLPLLLPLAAVVKVQTDDQSLVPEVLEAFTLQ